MTVDIHDPQDVERHLWEEMQVHPVGMLMLVGGEVHHAQPMTAFAEPAERRVYFFSRKSALLARDTALGHPAMFTLQQRDLQACIGGRLSLLEDPARVDRYWNAVVAAWYPQGRLDPELTLLQFDCDEAEVWLSKAGPIRFAWEIAVANARRREPDVAGKASISFH